MGEMKLFFFGPRHGFAGVSLDGKWAIVDKTGREVIPVKYGSYQIFDSVSFIKIEDEK